MQWICNTFCFLSSTSGHGHVPCDGLSVLDPALNLSKKLRFSLSRPGHLEDNNTKNHEERVAQRVPSGD